MQKKALSIKNVGHILVKKGLIDEEQYRHLLAKGDSQTARLQSYQQSGYSRRLQQFPEQVSPAEVISSFNLEVPGSGGRKSSLSTSRADEAEE